MAEKSQKSDKKPTEPVQKKGEATVQLTAAELRKISGGATGNSPPPPKTDGVKKS